MRVVVIGGSGHIGTFLVPRLVRAGHEVIAISRGRSTRYVEDDAWSDVRRITADREAEDRAGTFPARVADLEAEAVIDLISFTPESELSLIEAIRGRTAHLVYCGSIWRHGPSARHPITESTGTPPLGAYGVAKAATVELLKEETRSGGLITTSLHPGHIVGPGWHPVGPLGNFDPTVWQRLSSGQPLGVPGIGSEFMHHVHADDVAHGFQTAMEHREAAAGEDFDIVAPTALNVRGYAELAAAWFGREAALDPLTWDDFKASTTEEHHDTSWNHLMRNHCCSIDKARRLIHYRPRYQPEDAVLESIRWLIEHGELQIPAPSV